MSEVHKFLFDGVPVRGVLVRLTDAWTEILRRRASVSGAYAAPVQNLLGEMAAAVTLMQSNIKFNGALVFQVFGDGPVKLAVAEVQSDFGLRATATVVGEVAPDARLSALVNLNHEGRCAITLDPKNRLPGQQAYQGVVPLSLDADKKIESLSQVLEHYMQQSEQLETTIVLAADDKVAAGLLIQRLPLTGVANLAGASCTREDEIDSHEDYRRISILASSLQRDELLTLDSDTILRRLFWQEKLRRLRGAPGDALPHFLCTCSRERVGKMIVGLGQEEAQSILVERGEIEVGCEFCGAQQRFDAVDVGQLFSDGIKLPEMGPGLH
ncbi:MAG: Hsp33 family molecular chaperone HslO [Comamonadaceae bacterium]